MESTIRELCKRVAATGGLDLDSESITQYQDLIGHATVEENAELSNTPEFVESFYRIYGAAYGTCAAIKYYMANSEKVCDLRADAEMYKGDNKNLFKANQDLLEQIAEKENVIKELKRDMTGTEAELNRQREIVAERDKEIIQLKARMYDLMSKEV